MQSDRLRCAMDLFKQACVLDARARPAFLEAQCASDADLRVRVEALLAEDSRSISPLDLPGGGVPMLARQIATLSSVPLTPPAHDAAQDRPAIPLLSGDYRIIRIIGEGGMGTVYEAEQAIPRRRVALKAIRQGLASPELVRRFEHEAHILGRLHHPGIAQIYEAGAADAEHPNLAFIAMEYVDGLPLTDHAEAHKLSIRQRVELAIKVCDAVHHAHQRGVIHRDLKPTNILVEERGQPKVLDFGVARAIDAAGEAITTMHTLAGQLVGTIVYMSPEQVGGDPNEVDLRSDVYTLGVILFRLLTGRLPHELSQRPMPEMARIIREDPPQRLSAISRELRGDLDTICAKAIEKDKERRYQSAAELQTDLQAFLDGAPIAAKRDSALYVLRKHLRRYKFAALAASLVLLLSIGATIALLRMWRESLRQADIARGAQTAAQDAEAEQRAEAERAQAEARKSARINQYLQAMLTSAEPNRTRGQEISVREQLDQSAARVHKDLSGEPAIEAAVRNAIGETYASLGAYDQAEDHLREALAIRRQLLGDEHLDVADTEVALARVLRDTGRYAEAFELCGKSLQTHERLAGKENVPYARTLLMYGDLLHAERPDFDAAERAYLESIDIVERLYGRKSPYVAAALGNLGALYVELFRYADAEPVVREAHEIAQEVHGPRHSVSVMNAHNYAALLQLRGRLDEAEAIERVALDSALELYGREHPEAARNMVMMAELLLARGEAAEAEPLARQALAARKASLPAKHSLVTWAQVLLADVLAARGDAESAQEAETLAREAIEIYIELGRADYWPTHDARSVLGASLAAQGRFDEAEPMMLEGLEGLKNTQGLASRSVRSAVVRIIRLYDEWDRQDLAEEFRVMLADLPKR